MFGRSQTTSPGEAAAAALRAGPHDVCVRCGRPTPPGVSMCEVDNPGAIKSPSSTQVHGTIVLGVLLGFVLLAVLLRAASSGVGPFPSSVAGAATRADGGLDVVVTVANNGDRTSAASCRTASGVALDAPSSVFFTGLIPPGESTTFTQTLQPRTGGQPLSPGSVVVRCN